MTLAVDRVVHVNEVEYMSVNEAPVDYENPVRIVGLNIGNGCAYAKIGAVSAGNEDLNKRNLLRY